MQEFLLNEKVITELHMKSVDLKQRTKFAKKYDMPFKPTIVLIEKKQIQHLLEQQRKKLSKPKNDEFIPQNSPKTRNLLSTLKVQGLLQSQNQRNDSPTSFIKENYFTARGIKKSIKQFFQTKKNLPRTCSLVSAIRFTDYHVGPYDVNPDLRFKRSPRCFISPEGKRIDKGNKKFKLLQNKQNITDNTHNQTNRTTKGKRIQQKTTIKQMVDKQVSQQIKKRKAICRTAPTKHTQKMNAQQQLTTQYGIFDQDICKVEAKIYSQMRQNKQKIMKRNKERIGINIEKNKPYNSFEVNKNTVKLLKKYNCDNMSYFNKFMPKE